MGQSQKLHSQRVALHTGVGTLPTPLATDTAAGGDLTTWDRGGYRENVAAVQIDKASGAGNVTLTAPVVLHGFDEDVGRWREMGILNDGNDVIIGDGTTTDPTGFEARIVDGAVASRWALSAAAVTVAHTVNVTAVPIETRGKQ